MSLSIDTSTTKSIDGHKTSATWSHTVAADANYLIVGVGLTGNTGTLPYNISATYNGTAMTLKGTKSNGRSQIWIFELLAPASGAHNVVVSWTADGWGAAYATSVKGVNTDTPSGTFVSAAAKTVDASSAAGELVFDIFNDYGASSATVGSGQTKILNNTNQSNSGDSSGDYTTVCGSYEGGAATTTMSWTAAGSFYSIGALPVKPAPLGGQVIIWTSD